MSATFSFANFASSRDQALLELVVEISVAGSRCIFHSQRWGIGRKDGRGIRDFDNLVRVEEWRSEKTSWKELC